MSDSPRIALVVPGLAEEGGVPSVARFLYKVLEISGRYEPSLVSLATLSRDAQSVRVIDPRTWLRGPRVAEGRWHDKRFRHVGCYFTELEFMPYRPRLTLTRIPDQHDLVRVVE